MNHQRRIAILALLCFGVLAGAAVEDWTKRLEALSPDRPPEYFTLAEEIADVAETDADRELARHLFGLAGTLDPRGLGRSVALALADLEEDAQGKRRLLALAELLDSRVGDPNWLTLAADTTVDEAGAMPLSVAFSHYRRGHGARVTTLLDRSPDATALLAQYGDLIGGDRRFLENARRYRSGESPVKSDNELLDMLRLEEALLSGEQRSWSSELLLHRGRTLIEVDPDNLEAAFDVNPALPIYRNGRWTAPGTGSR